MTNILLGALVTFCAGLCVEGYFILGNQQRNQTTNEQILASNIRLLALHPGKSADRTEAPDDAAPFVPFLTLRRLADLRQKVTAPEHDLDRWADDGGATVPQPPTQPQPVAEPATRPQAAVLLEHAFARVGRDVPDEQDTGPVLDAADIALAGFNFVGGRRP